MSDNILRKDIIQIDFDVDLDVIKTLKASMEDLKKSISSMDSSDSLKKATDNAKSLGDAAKSSSKSLQDVSDTDTSNLNHGLDSIKSNLNDIGNKSSNAAFNGLKKVASVSFKALAAGIGAAATGLGVVISKSISDFSDYEQLTGGVETLFKDSGNKVMKYANDAYKTAGLSANDYMETVTGFSASLIQSLGGDTEKAADYANMAITDMSDNANKLGTDISSIQNAYQGFAKQNYTIKSNSLAA